MGAVVTDGTASREVAVGNGRIADDDMSGVQRTSAMRATHVAMENTAKTAAIGRIRNRGGPVVYSIDQPRSVGNALYQDATGPGLHPPKSHSDFSLRSKAIYPSRTWHGCGGAWPADV